MAKTAATQLSSLKVEHSAALAQLDRYKLLVDSVQDYAIFLLDTQGYIVTWNIGAQRNKGYAPEEIIGKHFSTFYQQKDIVARKPEQELVLAKKFGRVEDEDWRVRKDGSKFWANVVITALHDDDGQLVGFAKVTRDLTDRKRQEDKLREANSLLLQQRQELERLNASKDEFISLASHQLRTPATAIKQLLGMITEGFYGEVPATLNNVIERAYTSNERQIAIVNSLLKVAQIDAGKVVLNKVQTNIVTILEDMHKEHANTIEQRGQSLTLTIQNEPLISIVDPGYYRMVIDNLLDNASKYTKEGGTITIKATRSNGFIVVDLIDSGVGIAEADLGKLFEKFNRLPNELSDSAGGSGLGLYWAQKVIELHGGQITVRSEKNVGSTFRVAVPEGGVGA